MNKLYDAVKPLVIDDELLKRAIRYKKPGSSVEEELGPNFRIEFDQVENLTFSYLNILKIDNLIGFYSLKVLKLDNNVIENICNLSHLSNLEWLDLSFNKIKKIEGLDGLSKLKDLTLCNNFIETIEGMDGLVSLQVLSLGANNISDCRSLVYLRQFRNLAIVNLVGNPMSYGDYSPYCMLHVQKLRFLDYRLVDESLLQQAREQYQDEIRAVEDKERVQEQAFLKEQQRSKYLELLKEVNLLDIETLFSDLMKEDSDFAKLKVLPSLSEHLDEYRERAKFLTEEFKTIMLQHHEHRLEELANYNTACVKVLDAMDAESLVEIDKYSKKVKHFLRNDKKDNNNIVNYQTKQTELKNECNSLCDFLMEQETQIGEQMEEFVREYEREMSNLGIVVLEAMQGFWSRFRDAETAFHEKVMVVATSEVDRYHKNEYEGELIEEIKALLSDKETMSNIVHGSHDSQVLLVESKEDEMMKGEAKFLENSIDNVKKEATARNRERVHNIIMIRETFHKKLQKKAVLPSLHNKISK